MHSHDNPKAHGPIRKAVRESRAVIIVAFAIAIVYNVFSATSVPWIRESSKSDAPAATLTDLEPGTGDTVAPATETPHLVDTATVVVPPIDTAVAAGLTRAQLDSLEKVRKDSVKLARAEAVRVADSVNAAKQGGDFDALVARLANVSEIQTDVAKRLFDSKKVLFIDARPEDHFREGHITGAMNVYAEQWQPHIGDLVQIDRDKVIITYCGGGDECELSHDLARNLKALGFKTVVVYKGGITDWKAKKYPVATQ